ncbi:MAG: hypothetical protein ACK5LX_06940 [Oscillospiraceae bacterium]
MKKLLIIAGSLLSIAAALVAIFISKNKYTQSIAGKEHNNGLQTQNTEGS